MMEKAGPSILSIGLVEFHILLNGVYVETFRSSEGRLAARSELSLDLGNTVVVFAASDDRNNIGKDMATLRRALD